MRCRPVAPDCSLIKSNIKCLFLPFSNQLFIFYLLYSLSLAAIAAARLLCAPRAAACQRRKRLEPWGSSHGGKLFPFVSEMQYGRLFFILIFCSFQQQFCRISLPFILFLCYRGERTGSDWMSALIYRSCNWRDLTGCADGLPW